MKGIFLICRGKKKNANQSFSNNYNHSPLQGPNSASLPVPPPFAPGFDLWACKHVDGKLAIPLDNTNSKNHFRVPVCVTG